jgi:hypothetical protein
MIEDNLEMKCKQAILRIADDVKDINYKLTNFLENYREDYYRAMDRANYHA